MFIKPDIGSFKVVDVERKDIDALRQKHRNTPYQANRTKQVLSKMFNMAEIWGVLPYGSNPCRYVTKYLDQKRERYLSSHELQWGFITDMGMELPDTKIGARHIPLAAATRAILSTLPRTSPTKKQQQ